MSHRHTHQRVKLLDIVRNGPLMTLMLGHFTVDMYAGLLPVLFPLLTGRFALDLKTVGMVSLAYTGIAAISQPLFGWVADRYGTRFIGAALIWTAVMFATIGFAPSFPVLLLLAGAAGLGSGAYHPLGALNANAVIPEPQRNTAMSVYVTGGTCGVASGPLIGALLFSAFGLRGTAPIALPSLIIAVWLLIQLRAIGVRRPSQATRAAASPAPVPLLPLLTVIGVMMSRSWTVFSIQAFIPTWYASLGYDASFYGPLATTVVLASAVGTIGAGTLADRFGKRVVMIGSLVLTIPVVLLFARFTGPVAFVTGGLVGLLAASTAPLMLVLGQQLMRGRAGLASGLILGLGFVTGAIGVPITGAYADAFGLPAAIQMQAFVALATIPIAWLLPRDDQVRASTELMAPERGAARSLEARPERPAR